MCSLLGKGKGKGIPISESILWVRVLLLIMPMVSAANTNTNDDHLLVSRIAFGSCANQNAPQPIWDAILEMDPQVFVWLGDNIYGDKRRPLKVFGKERTFGPWKNSPRFIPSTPYEMKSSYLKLKSLPSYSRLRHSAKVIGTWDDHDYGLNDAGSEFPFKTTNQKLLLDFLDEPNHSPRRNQRGVYASYTFGASLAKQVKIILLDTRYHRDPVSSDGTMLGTSQWAWLENQLKAPPSAITIIASSIQVVSNLSATTGPLFHMESWGRFPKERNRLFKLIADTKRDGVIFISGDVHFGEISRYDCAATGYPLYDITSSGLTQAVEKAVPSPFHFLVRLVARLTPTTMRVMDKNCRYSSCTFGQPNFGAIEIDWDANPVTVRIEVRDTSGLPVAAVNISLSELRRSGTGTVQDSASSTAKTSGGIQRHCSFEVSLPWIVRHRLAILFYSTIAVLGVVFVGLVVVVAFVCRKCLRKCKRD